MVGLTKASGDWYGKGEKGIGKKGERDSHIWGPNPSAKMGGSRVDTHFQNRIGKEGGRQQRKRGEGDKSLQAILCLNKWKTPNTGPYK